MAISSAGSVLARDRWARQVSWPSANRRAPMRLCDPEHAKSGYSGASAEARRVDPSDCGRAEFADGSRRAARIRDQRTQIKFCRPPSSGDPSRRRRRVRSNGWYSEAASSDRVTGSFHHSRPTTRGLCFSACDARLFADVQFLALKRRWVGVGEIPERPAMAFPPENQVCTGLPAGGNRIRTIGPALTKGCLAPIAGELVPRHQLTTSGWVTRVCLPLSLR